MLIEKIDPFFTSKLIPHSLIMVCASMQLANENFLRESIPDTIIHISGYAVFRRDRIGDNHGGVCIYVHADHLRKFS